MNNFSFGDIQLHYLLNGCGEKTVVLVHGFMEDHSMWDNICPRLNKWGFKTISIDLPCHGESRFYGEAMQVDEMAKSVDALLNSLHIENPVLIGHSLGGYLGLELLRIRSLQLILLHSNFWEDPEEKKRDRDRIISIVKRAKDVFIDEAIPHLFYDQNRAACHEDIQTLVARAKQIPAREIAACSYGLRDRKPQYDLFEKHNITMIHGENDPILPKELLDSEIQKVNKSVTLYTIPDCGHMSIWEKPGALIELLKKILIQ